MMLKELTRCSLIREISEEVATEVHCRHMGLHCAHQQVIRDGRSLLAVHNLQQAQSQR